jgi:hypothetical protein
MKKMEKARKKAESISENVDVSEREKWKQIKEYAFYVFRMLVPNIRASKSLKISLQFLICLKW